MWISWLLGCAGGTSAAPTWYADVAPIAEGRCVSCHFAGGVAPMSLESYEDAAPYADAMADAVSERRMPPWPAGSGGVALHDDPSLTDDQIALIAAWAAADAPAGDPDAPGAEVPRVGSALSRIDRELSMPEPYQPVVRPDEYRCFVLDWPDTEETWVTGFGVVPGNGEVVHHVAAFLIPPDTVLGPEIFDVLADWDAADEGPGYSCFGGPSRTGEALDAPISQIAQWVPGNQGTDFPAGTGIRVAPGSKLVLQVHYYAPEDHGPDQTRLQLRVDSEVVHPAGFAPWLDALWTFDGMPIPAGMGQVTYQAVGPPEGFFGFLLGDQLDFSRGFDIHSALLHQHKLGTHATIAVLRQSGEREVLVDVPDYDFNWQITYAFDPVRFEPGDQLELTCVFDNPAATQAPGVEPADVNWGEGTGEEMCVANLYVSDP
jgi:hypothetical protein